MSYQSELIVDPHQLVGVILVEDDEVVQARIETPRTVEAMHQMCL